MRWHCIQRDRFNRMHGPAFKVQACNLDFKDWVTFCLCKCRYIRDQAKNRGALPPDWAPGEFDKRTALCKAETAVLEELESCWMKAPDGGCGLVEIFECYGVHFAQRNEWNNLRYETWHQPVLRRGSKPLVRRSGAIFPISRFRSHLPALDHVRKFICARDVQIVGLEHRGHFSD